MKEIYKGTAAESRTVIDLGTWSATYGASARYRGAKLTIDHSKAWAFILRAMESKRGRSILGSGFVTVEVEK